MSARYVRLCARAPFTMETPHSCAALAANRFASLPNPARPPPSCLPNPHHRMLFPDASSKLPRAAATVLADHNMHLKFRKELDRSTRKWLRYCRAVLRHEAAQPLDGGGGSAVCQRGSCAHGRRCLTVCCVVATVAVATARQWAPLESLKNADSLGGTLELAHAGGAVARARRFVLDGVRGLRLPCFLPHENERRERAARQKSAQRISAIRPN
jgi:hypothetical protein